MKKKILLAGIGCGMAAAALIAGCLGFVITPVTDMASNTVPEGIKPFHSSSGVGSNYYRIPAMVTAQDGTVVAAMDARFGGTHDSPNNLDTAVSRSVDQGRSWEDARLALSFEDWQNTSPFLRANGKLTVVNSASAIDPSLLQDEQTGRIFMLVDGFPYGTGSATAQRGSGYTELDGKKYRLLRREGEKEYRYTVREGGAIYDAAGVKTAYSLNSRNEIMENGELLTVRQKRVVYWYTLSFGIRTKTEVPMNLLYQDALFHPVMTSYLYLMYSDDSGRTWSDPVDLNAQVKPEASGFMGVCPGRGVQLTSGDHAGRLLFPVYLIDPETGVQRFATLYSEDHGATWQAGECAAPDPSVGSMSETQLVQFPDGSLQAFSRTPAGHPGCAWSTDGGETWSPPELLKEIPLSGGSGCQLSVIRYQGEIDGRQAVLMSAPAGDGRKNGCLYVGLIRPGRSGEHAFEIDWAYRREITGANTHFAYSCLTQLTDGTIGLLYEQANTPQTVDTTLFEVFTVEQLCERAMQPAQ